MKSLLPLKVVKQERNTGSFLSSPPVVTHKKERLGAFEKAHTAWLHEERTTDVSEHKEVTGCSKRKSKIPH